jgi:hypothetical protein
MGSLLEPLLPLVKFPLASSEVQQLLRLESSSCLLPSDIPVSCHVPPAKCRFCLMTQAPPPPVKDPPAHYKCPSCLRSSVPPAPCKCLSCPRSSVSPAPCKCPSCLWSSLTPVYGQASLLSPVKHPSRSLQVYLLGSSVPPAPCKCPSRSLQVSLPLLSLLSSDRCHSTSCPTR